ncbi:RNA polymerase II holoenzyme cyclin-like subunit [Polyrhizophydium stewartii]|uniref:RNA polymerase II holoenzyme cyclin-like subunit n=1 Tax=Polyrhizophydium stewartii TaxID=2732419 RepID=A0ABR4NL78_9FUNG|nr:hypothetical protein HK105_007642 [Polyrhizophydium stewartii]
MASNFWDSTHVNQWILDSSVLAAARERELDFVSSKDAVYVSLYYSNAIQKICRRLQVRQQVIGTALVYWKRFFAKNAYFDIDPLLVGGTAIYVACKIEECPHHIRNVVNESRNCLGADLFPYDAATIADFEFYFLEELEFSLIVFHPYRPLQQLLARLNLTKPCLQTAWYIVNDTYKTDIPLMYPPHLIALSAIFVVAAIVDSNNQPQAMLPAVGDEQPSVVAVVTTFFSELNIDIRDILCITQHLLDSYHIWQGYIESAIPYILARFPRQSAGPTKQKLPILQSHSVAPQQRSGQVQQSHQTGHLHQGPTYRPGQTSWSQTTQPRSSAGTQQGSQRNWK